ncbi:DUF6261 family protein [Ancylomarina sp.]|uniref:DUF6261 family protein n=1 Tax=Ancylomarina sp. TaxID=1970196 RepID=UPI0035687D3A
MTLQILSHADTNEIGSIADNTVQELQKSDWSTDLYLNTNLSSLKTEAGVLTAAVGVVRKNDFTQQLMIQDAIFDQVFIGFKQFVTANTYSLDEDKAKNAEVIWENLEAHDLNLYRLGYEQQIFLCQSLLNEFDKPKNKAAIASLDGVSDQVVLLKTHNDSLRTIFQESKIDEAAKAEGIAASSQKHVVRNILNNDILPYMEVMSKAKPTEYAASYNVISEYVTSINIKVKARKTRSENQMEEEILPEETNN